jgi:hypothetical protein
LISLKADFHYTGGENNLDLPYCPEMPKEKIPIHSPAKGAGMSQVIKIAKAEYNLFRFLSISYYL